jgi:hypothetical protein
MDGLRNKVVLDLCVTPATLVTATIGGTCLMLSAMLGSTTGFFGFIMLAVSVGIIATRFVFCLDDVYKKALEQIVAQKYEQRNMELDQLDKKLLLDRDPRDQTALRNLRSLYDGFTDDVRKGKISAAVPVSMHDQIEKIFNTCVSQLQRQHEIWSASNKVSSDLKTSLYAQREKILDDVESSVNLLATVIDEVRTLGLKVNREELSDLQTRLKAQLAAAKEIDSITSESEDDYSRFEKYQ